MENSRRVTIIDSDGVKRRGSVPPQPAGEGLLLRLEGGETVYVPRDAVTERDDEYTLELRFADLQSASVGEGVGFGETFAGRSAETVVGTVAEGERQVLPVLEETLRVEKRQVERGKVRVRKVVREHEGVVDEPLFREQVEVERVAVNELVDYPPAVREETSEEGDVTVIPLVEEVLVVEKRLLLKEEVRVTKRRTERREPQRVTLRREEAIVERLGPGEEGGE